MPDIEGLLGRLTEGELEQLRTLRPDRFLPGSLVSAIDRAAGGPGEGRGYYVAAKPVVRRSSSPMSSARTSPRQSLRRRHQDQVRQGPDLLLAAPAGTMSPIGSPSRLTPGPGAVPGRDLPERGRDGSSLCCLGVGLDGGQPGYAVRTVTGLSRNDRWCARCGLAMITLAVLGLVGLVAAFMLPINLVPAKSGATPD